MVEDRTVLHKPLQYILGTQPFCGLEIVTRPPVLIPRWETEEWTNRIIELLRPRLSSSKPPFRILDVCTGTGCIGLALAAHLPKDSVEITGLDISNDAITLAQENLLIHKSMIKNPIEFHQKDIFQYERDSTFNLIVSNPPYISHEEYKNIDPGVKDWEDPRALVTEEDGTRIHKRIIHVAKYCQPVFDDVPRVVMEIGGTHQISRLTKEMEDNELHNTTIWKDLAEKDRVIAAL
ncbi:S-adenosyl-L-methionine-dependent methyltransferase [Pilobolus umbonatus]|nr:S-adenosyl-L-methionine-dependent methyltransferase [Pilobolus umbonatus]